MKPPSSPAGYSGTPLPEKLGIRAGSRVRFVDAPADFGETLGTLPEDVVFSATDTSGGLDLVLWFTRSAEALEHGFDAHAALLVPAGMLWIAWLKKASKVRTDLTEDVIRGIALAHGMVDVKVCAIDAVWSGLKLVYRLRDRPRT
jgi:hypothetical protein